MSIFTVPAYGGGGGAGTPGPPGPTSLFLRYTHGGGVPSGGVQFLRLGVGVFSSQDGDLLTADGTIKGISISLDDGTDPGTYDVNVLSDPSGGGGTGPTVAATLALPAATLRQRTRALAIPVTGLLDLGVEVRRTSGGAVASTFGRIVVLVEVTIP